MASTSLKSGDINLAIDYSKLQVGYAEDANNVADEEAAYESLASTYGTKHDYLRGLAWIDLALRLDPGDPAVQKILQKLTHATQGVQWPAQGGGTYAQYAGRAMWNSLCASAKSNGGVHFTLTAYRPGKAWREYGPASYGEVTGDATRTANNQVQYDGNADFPDCRIGVTFSANGAVLSQEGDCGFGYGLKAAGPYERLSLNGRYDCAETDLP